MTSIFVFGSNLAGRHGAGAALEAHKHHGAQLGVGEGMTGESYAIPTKDARLRTRPLADIARSIETFKRFAWSRPYLEFQVTRIGCGLAGYRDEQIAPMFAGAPRNCILPAGWRAPIFDHLDGEHAEFSRVAREMVTDPMWRSVPEWDDPAPVSGEIDTTKRRRAA